MTAPKTQPVPAGGPDRGFGGGAEARPGPRSHRLSDPGASPQVYLGPISSVRARRRGTAEPGAQHRAQLRDVTRGALQAEWSCVDPRTPDPAGGAYNAAAPT